LDEGSIASCHSKENPPCGDFAGAIGGIHPDNRETGARSKACFDIARAQSVLVLLQA
jgi:hypothetical protein